MPIISLESSMDSSSGSSSSGVGDAGFTALTGVKGRGGGGAGAWKDVCDDEAGDTAVELIGVATGDGELFAAFGSGVDVTGVKVCDGSSWVDEVCDGAGLKNS